MVCGKEVVRSRLSCCQFMSVMDYSVTKQDLRSRSIIASVPLPYARRRTASSSICCSVRPGLLFTAFMSYVDKVKSELVSCNHPEDFNTHTVFVMPSVNLTNSIFPSVCSHSGKRVRIKRMADVCESALL
jgi:hypothetical protein